jgi:hypothetical protein
MKEESENVRNSPGWPILRLYELISGPPEHERPWSEVALLFMPGARIRMELTNPDGTIRSNDWLVEEFAREAAEHYRKAGFWEREIARKTEQFGNIAHIFSTYESRINDPNSNPVARGINSVQMLKHNGQWKIAGIVFHIEQPDMPIPDKYLP